MISFSSILLSARKVQSIPSLTFAKQIKRTLCSVSSCTTRLLSAKHCLHMVLAHTTTCFVPRSIGQRSGTQASINRSSTSCIIHEARNFFSGGSAAPNTQQIYTSLKPPHFPATSTLQHPRGYRQTHAAEVPSKKTALDFAPGSIWVRSTTFASSAQTALLYTATLRTPLSSSKDATDLRTFGLKDVLLPPGAWTALRNSLNALFFTARHRHLFPAQPRSQDTLSTSRKYPGYGWSRVC